MPFWKRPEYGWLIHLIVSIAPVLINIAIAYIQDPSNPLGLNPSILGLVITALNVILSQLRNAGQTVVTTTESTTTLGSAPNIPSGTTLIIPAPAAKP